MHTGYGSQALAYQSAQAQTGLAQPPASVMEHIGTQFDGQLKYAEEIRVRLSNLLCKLRGAAPPSVVAGQKEGHPGGGCLDALRGQISAMDEAHRVAHEFLSELETLI